MSTLIQRKRTTVLVFLWIIFFSCGRIFAEENKQTTSSVTNESEIVVNIRMSKSDGTTEGQLLRPGQTFELPFEVTNVKTSFPTTQQLRQLSEEERKQVSATLFPELRVILTYSDGTTTQVDDAFLGPGTPTLQRGLKFSEVSFEKYKTEVPRKK